MQGDGYVGMLQPRDETTLSRPLTEISLYDIGCLGAVEQVRPRQSRDGYAVLLRGLLRFESLGVTENDRGYPEARANYEPFLSDLDEPWEEADFRQVRDELQRRIEAKRIEFDMSLLGQVPGADIVNGLSQVFPFSMAERQALLEAASVQERQQVLLDLMKMGLSRPATSTPPVAN